MFKLQIQEYIFFKLSKIEGGTIPPRKIRGGDTSPPSPPGSPPMITGVNPGGMGDVSPHFFGWGDGLYNIPPPPLFEDKKLKFLTVKLLKTPKIARSLCSLAHKCILKLDLGGFASTVHVFFSWHHLCKERCRIKQTLCNRVARKSIAGLPIIQVKGTWRSQGGIILAQKSPMTKEWNSPLKYFLMRSVTCAYQAILLKFDI